MILEIDLLMIRWMKMTITWKDALPWKIPLHQGIQRSFPEIVSLSSGKIMIIAQIIKTRIPGKKMVETRWTGYHSLRADLLELLVLLLDLVGGEWGLLLESSNRCRLLLQHRPILSLCLLPWHPGWSVHPLPKKESCYWKVFFPNDRILTVKEEQVDAI